MTDHRNIIRYKGPQFERFLQFMIGHMPLVADKYRTWLAKMIWMHETLLKDAALARWEGWAHAALLGPNGEILQKEVGHNIGSEEGMDYLLTAGLADGTKITAWYIPPFSGSITPAKTTTAGTFDSVATEITAYDETTRRQNVFASITNENFTGTNINITANASFTLRGLGLISNSTKGGTSGTLLAHANLAAAISAVNTQVIALRYDGSITLA